MPLDPIKALLDRIVTLEEREGADFTLLRMWFMATSAMLRAGLKSGAIKAEDAVTFIPQTFQNPDDRKLADEARKVIEDWAAEARRG